MLLSFAAILSLFSCYRAGAPNTAGELILSEKVILFKDVGENAELSAKIIKDGRVVDNLSYNDSVVWTTSNSEVAICEGGKITAVGFGACTIRATYENYTSTCFVSNPDPRPILNLSTADVEFDNIGREAVVVATSKLGEDISSKIQWISTNENIATCVGGKITAVGYGSCTVMAIYNNKTAICHVTINNPQDIVVSLSEKTLSISSGATHTLTARTTDTESDVIKWISSNPEIARCENGTVTARKAGVCVITAMDSRGNTASCVVTVDNYKNTYANEEYLDFEFKNLGKEVKTVDRATGKLLSSSIVTSYKMDSTQLLEDGRLVVEITLNCVKTYDYLGEDGKSPAIIMVNIYRENNAFLDRKQYKTMGTQVGQEYTVKLYGFTVQTNTDGTPRSLYMTFSTTAETTKN